MKKMIKINVVDQYNETIDCDIETIAKDLEQVFFEKFKTNKDATLILVNIIEIQEINNQYRHLNKPTDVISFEEFDDDYLGEIFICVDKAKTQAEEYGHSLSREMAFLLCHGLLHLHGYDHIEKKDEVIMFKLQDELMANTKYRRD